MKIRTSITGGFAGNLGEREVRVLDTDQLSDADQADVESLIAQSGFFDLPNDLARPGGNDVIASTIQINDAHREHRVTVNRNTERQYLDAVQPILDLVREKGSSVDA